MRFLDKRTNEIKDAYSVEFRDGKVYVQFEKNGKIYGYKDNNIELLNDDSESNKKHLIIYSYVRTCYKCDKDTEILTYIVWDNADNENLKWNIVHIIYPQREMNFFQLRRMKCRRIIC